MISSNAVCNQTHVYTLPPSPTLPANGEVVGYPTTYKETIEARTNPLFNYKNSPTDAKPLPAHESNPTDAKPLPAHESNPTDAKPLPTHESNPTDAKPLPTHESSFAKASPPPVRGGIRGGDMEEKKAEAKASAIAVDIFAEPCLTPIESVQQGDFVYDHEGKARRVLRVVRRCYHGRKIGLLHELCSDRLWLTADHRVLAKMRPRTLGGQQDWSGSPLKHLERRKELRREASPPERRLWSALRGEQLGYKFRRQHPVGKFIADFYSRDAHLVVEVDGATHFTLEGMAYDKQRDDFMRALGLDVLRFTVKEIYGDLEGVCLAIKNHCQVRLESVKGARWVQAGSLCLGDLVFWGLERRAVGIESIEEVYVEEEETYDLEVEGGRSFLTEVCVVRSWDGIKRNGRSG